MPLPNMFRHPVIATLTITGLVLGLLAGYAIHLSRQMNSAEAAQELEARARIAQEQTRALLKHGDLDGLQTFCATVATTTGTRLTVLRPNGFVVADSHEEPARMENHADRPEIRAARQGRIEPTRRYSYTLNAETLYVAVPLEQDGTLLGILRAALPTTVLEQQLAALRNGVMLAALLLFALAGGVVWQISRRLSLPLATMRDWVANFAAGRPAGPLEAAAPPAVADLATALNQMAQELTERINRIDRQRNELAAVFGSMVEGVLTVDAEERIQSFNPAALALLGLDSRKLKGRSALEAIRNLKLQQCIKATLAGNDTEEDELILPDAKGLARSFYLRGVPLRANDTRTTGALIVLSDVTNLRRLETVRRDFVANVSHELKTPITSITGFVETLRDGALEEPENARRFLEIIHQQATRLHAIVEDLLALSRLEKETERNEIALVRHPLKESLAAATQTCLPAATAKLITLRQECPASLAALVNPPLFEQALVNLIDNAIKYSPTGSSVLVSARATDAEVVVAVEDQGVGIAPRDQARVFERFFRVDKARSSTMGGTGLGLAIVKHIVQAHGGRVTLESAPGKGSTFTIHLRPATEPAA